MVARFGYKWHFSRGLAMVWLLTAGIAGMAIAPGCGEVTTTSIEPDVVSGMTLKIEPAAPSVAPGKTLDLAVKANDSNGSPVKDGTMISLANDALGTITPTSAATTSGIARATFQAGTKPGSSTIKASAGGVSSTVSVMIDPAAPPAVPGDQIPISSVTFYDASPVDFKVTATLSNVLVDAPTGGSGPVKVCWDWTHPPWPTYWEKDVTGNMWIIAKIDGRWCGGTWEMMAPKLDNHACRTTEATAGQPPFIQSSGPTAGWHPKSGEQIGHMISTITRGGIPSGSPNERTPIVVTNWP